jgi:predicted CXXCH cytochrome family protein
MGIFLLLLLALNSTASQPKAPRATSVRAADAACERCHEKIYRSYLHTPMADASGPATEKLIPGEYDHALSQIDYTLKVEDGKAVLGWRDLREQGNSGHWDLSYFLGSGHLGTTWLYSVNHYLFESPVAWYTASHRYDMKPGLAEANQMLPALPMQSECMRCHMSAVQRSEPGSMNLYSGLAFLHGGITCESCHGDTTQHVLSEGKSPVVNPARLNADKRDSICISCHLEGDITVQRAGHNILDYRPGDSISNFLAYYVYAKSDPLARGVSEVEQFNTSMCKRMSGDRMSCTTCHDPHFTPAPSERVAFYRAKCLACHGTPAFVKTHHPENPDCVGCHMPHSGSQNIPHVAWTDHRILARPDEDASAQSTATDVLKPIFSPGANSRDLGMAYYLAYLKGNRADEAQAWSLLSSQPQALQSDKAALDALGILSAERGDSQAAGADFRRVLSLDAHDLTAQSDLGALLAREGKITESAEMLHSAFDRNRDVVGLAMNLARVECMMGDVSGVRSTLQTALIYNPAIQEMQHFIKSADACHTKALGGEKR